MQQPRTAGLRFREPAGHADRPHRQRRQPAVGKAHALQPPQPFGVLREAIGLDELFRGDDLLELAQEPWIVACQRVDLLDREAFAEGLADEQQPIGRAAAERSGDRIAPSAFQFDHAVEPVEPGFKAAQRLLQAFLEIAADRHHLADRFHRSRQLGFRALELLEGEARDLGDDIIDSRLERRRGGAGDLVGDLVERVADRQLGRDAGDGKARRFRGQRGRAADARVHLDHDQPAILRVDCELDVAAARFDADFAQHRDAGAAHDLIFLVGQRQRRGDGDRIARVDAHRIDILDRADDDRIVLAVAHHLHLVFFPAEQRFLDQHLGGGARFQPLAHDPLELGLVVGDAPARPAEREAGADDCGQARAFEHRKRLVERGRHPAARAFEADLVHRLTEPLAVLRLVDRIGMGADHLDAMFGQHTHPLKVERAIERGLPAHCRQQSIGPLARDDPGNDFGGDRLDIGRIGHVRIGHDRRRVRVHQDNPIPFLAQRLDRLRAGIIELARLPDNNGPSANDEDRGDVSAFGH